MKKLEIATQLIERQIEQALSTVATFPSERQLSEVLGLSRVTVRGAIQQLLVQGRLIRQENGRLGMAPTTHADYHRNIGFAFPVTFSADYDEWIKGVRGALEGHCVTVYPISYDHWTAPDLHRALTSLDGLFFIPHVEKTPDWLAKKMKHATCRVVVLGQDESQAGLPSVTIFSPTAEKKLLDYVFGLGHRRIDCINTQSLDAIIEERIEVWKRYTGSQNIAGQLRSCPSQRPIESAYQIIQEGLQSGGSIGSAIFCTTGFCAIGVMRALQEANLEIGRDISVFAMNGESLGRFWWRSLTSVEVLPRARYLRQAIQWMLREQEWTGSLLFQSENELFEGESTGTAPPSPNVYLSSLPH